MTTFKSFTLSLLLLTSVSSFTKAQGLPDLPNKPQPELDMKWICPPLGRVTKTTDVEKIKLMNRIDGTSKYHEIGFMDLKSLTSPQGLLNKKRPAWTPQQKEVVKKNEGIPVVVYGYFLLTAVNGTVTGAMPEPPELCNCLSKDRKQVDFRLWLVNNPNDPKSEAIVAQMTPRVRARRKDWNLKNLTYIAQGRFLVRVYGWLLFEDDEQKRLGRTRATLWEIHPVIQIEFREKGEWITL